MTMLLLLGVDKESLRRSWTGWWTRTGSCWKVWPSLRTIKRWLVFVQSVSSFKTSAGCLGRGQSQDKPPPQHHGLSGRRGKGWLQMFWTQSWRAGLKANRASWRRWELTLMRVSGWKYPPAKNVIMFRWQWYYWKHTNDNCTWYCWFISADAFV